MKSHFRVFFQPSSSVSPGLSITRPSPGPVLGNASNSVLRLSLSTNFDSTKSASSAIGFSWGPLADAFPPAVPTSSANPEHGTEYRPTLIPVLIQDTFAYNLLVPTPAGDGGILSTPRPFADNAPYTTVLLAVLTHSARTILYTERALSDALMCRGGAFQTEKP